MAPSSLCIAFVVMHTSPLDEPGTKDAGGMNVVVLEQARQLARLGHRVELITRRSAPDQPSSVALEPGLRLHHLDAGPAELLEKGAHELYLRDFMLQFAELSIRLPIDIVHAEHWFSGIASLQVAQKLGVPMVQSFHSIAAHSDTPLAAGERAEAPGRLAAEAHLAQEADLVIAVSKAESQTVWDRLGGSRIEVVPLGVDIENFRPLDDAEAEARRERQRAGERSEVLVVGRLHPLKGFDLAIQALAEIPASDRPTLHIVGTPPPDDAGYEASLHAAAAVLGEGAVRFEGALRRDELADRMRHADLVLVPSHSETFGLIALEAAACGIAVIASADAGGLNESVREGETGLLVSGRDPQVWAAAIRGLLADEARRISMSRAARTFAEQRTWAASTDRLLEVYHRAISAGSHAEGGGCC